MHFVQCIYNASMPPLHFGMHICQEAISKYSLMNSVCTRSICQPGAACHIVLHIVHLWLVHSNAVCKDT